mmetsp:Transcript_20820/g.58674  ORF Transcript_20820/g.58674 Transcript_20820/m.58674 type:complete len:636 (+) Transcript_20820:60-1967(+)
MGSELSLHQPSLWEEQEAKQRPDVRSTKSSAYVAEALGAWDGRLVDDPARPAAGALSLRGVVALTCASACGCYFTRLAFQDFVRNMSWFRRLNPGKQLTVELYALGTLHAAAWALFSASKIVTGRAWDPQGTTRALSLSAGYYFHNLVVLRSLILHDPLMLIHHVMDLIAHTSMLRSPGTQWLAPVIMSKHLPNVWLNVLRLFRVLDIHPGPRLVRLNLWVYGAAFLLTKGFGVPAACAWHWVLRPKPEFHQPRYLPAKLALIVNFFIYHVWFQQVRRGAPDVLRFAGRDLSLHELREVALKPLGRALGATQLVGAILLYAVGPLALPVIALALRSGRRNLGVLLTGALAALTFSPLPKQGLRWFTSSWLFRASARTASSYFNFQVVQEGEFAPDGRYLCAMFPHGFQATGTFLFLPHLVERGFQPNTCGASVLFALPVLRQLLAAMGGCPASKERLSECLQRPYPHNLTLLVPGGIAEMFLTRPDVEHILSDRKGFVRCAIQAGADIVPCYCLGNTQVFRVVGGALGRLCERLSRWARISILPFHGLWGTLIPYPHPVMILVGRPISVGPAVAEPTNAQVDEIHAHFFEELSALFERHKHLVPGYEDKKLFMGAQAALPPPPLPELADYSRSRL